jgi:hypothetical protein
MNALSCAFNAAIRARHSFVNSSEEICRLASAAAASQTPRQRIGCSCGAVDLHSSSRAHEQGATR